MIIQSTYDGDLKGKMSVVEVADEWMFTVGNGYRVQIPKETLKQMLAKANGETNSANS